MDAHIVDAEIDKQLALLEQAPDPSSQGRVLAILSVLFSRCSDSNLASVAASIPLLTRLAHDSTDHLVKANAVAVLGAAAALDDELAAAVAASASQPLVMLLQKCAALDGAADLQLNVVAALGQLARDQHTVAQAVMDPPVLSALLALADSGKPVKLQEAVADSLCALASHDWTRQQLCEAGTVLCVSELLRADHLEVSVRCLMVLGMLLTGNQTAQQQLATSPAAVQQLLALMKQQEDMDAKIIARDLLGLLMRDEELRSTVEAAIRQAAEAQQQKQQQQQKQEQGEGSTAAAEPSVASAP